MRLTLMSDYAMRLLMHVAKNPQRLCTISEVARTYNISEAHLMKVTHQLALTGWIETVRGKGGGMRLATSPDQINLGAVVKSIEPDFAIVECLADSDDTTCQLNGSCQLTGIMTGALQSFMSHLSRYTLADLLLPVGISGTGPQLVSFHKPPTARVG
ncbi:MAG TPA: Rrf2 family transcriptional regulator [Rhodoferax sp.]